MDEQKLKEVEEQIMAVRRLPPFAIVCISYTEQRESHIEDGVDDVRVVMSNCYMDEDENAIDVFVEELGALDVGIGSGTYTFIVWFYWEELEVIGGGCYTPDYYTLVDFEPYSTTLAV